MPSWRRPMDDPRQEGARLNQLRVLAIGVADFDDHPRLAYAPDLALTLADELKQLGYVPQALPDSSHLTSERIGALVKQVLADGAAGDLTVIHLSTHGRGTDGDATVFALGSDGVTHADSSIAHWLTMCENVDGPTTLFLLDLCDAGIVARLPWQGRLESAQRSWVIAACGVHERAYGGRFSQAVVNVLRALRTGELDIGPSVEHVPLRTVARAIRQEVNRLSLAANAIPQTVTASLVDLSSAAEPPFFPNPAYLPDRRVQMRASVDEGVLPFLDDLKEGLDARHFVERASGLGGLLEMGASIGCFSGRARELRRISPWLSGHADPSPLCVVTGSPGSGKSALLGILVCAASTKLRSATQHIWNQVAQAPVTISGLVAVHARQRGVDGIAASVIRQLGLPENLPIAELVTTLRSRAAVLVIDALDEANDPARIMNELLLPLVEPGEPVRLLVGVRNYADFAPLFARATTVDLDQVKQQVLENDLFDYVQGLLRATPNYRGKHSVSAEFAGAVSAALAVPGQSGPFLVAGLYTRYFVTRDQTDDTTAAAAIGRRVPRDLAGVLELDLELHRDNPWLRPVLTVLAHARGAGVPVSILRRLAPVFGGAAGAPGAAEIRTALHTGSFYIRQSVDVDHSNLYRLFHQGLADTLGTAAPFGERALDALLSSLGPPAARDWDAAEPYLFRHLLEHAGDGAAVAELLSDPGLVLNERFTGVSPFGAIGGPAELAMAAARAGLPALALRAAKLAGLRWRPKWIIGAVREPSTVSGVLMTDLAAVAISEGGHRIAGIGAKGLYEWEWSNELVPTLVDLEPRVTGTSLSRPTLIGEIAVASPGGLAVRRSPGGTFVLTRKMVSRVFRQPSGRYLCVGDDSIFGVSGRGDIETLCDLTVGHGEVRIGAYGDLVVGVSRSPKGLLVYDMSRSAFVPVEPDASISCFDVSEDGRFLVVGTLDGEVAVMASTNAGEWAPVKVADVELSAIAFSPSAQCGAVGTVDGRIIGWRESQVVIRCAPSKSAITSISLSDDLRGVALDADGIAYHFFEDSLRDRPAGPAHAANGDHDVVKASVTAVEVDPADRIFLAYSDGHVSWMSPGGERLLVRIDPAVGELKHVVVAGQSFVVARAGHHGHFVGTNYDPVPLSRLGFVSWSNERSGLEDRIVVGSQLVTVVGRGNQLVTVSQYDSEPENLGQHEGLTALRCVYCWGTAVVVSGGHDGVVRFWSLAGRLLLESSFVGSPVRRILLHDGGKRILVLTTGELICFECAD
ncbi:NACHT and WD repeat domain-containing protein [Amycolatopsis sp. NPDC004625]|uniref:NACHT and WD repeat domain-containing protein n=1 Tax=Amycolatopsis sp. NPDC004625 TaxID=3154670 RepID=UPI0033B4752D